MHRFVVFKGDAPASDRVLRHAFLLGPDNVSLAGKIEADAGVITCTRATGETLALATQVDLDQTTLDESTPELARAGVDLGTCSLRPLGSLTLQTCLLPDRERPYLLSLELARHRLMLFVNKLEEWMLTDLPADHPAMQRFELAREVFTRALVAQRSDEPGSVHGFTPSAHRLAVAALFLAVDAGERLALTAAERDFSRRAAAELYERAAESSPRKGSGAPVVNPNGVGVLLPGRPAVGITAEPRVFNEQACNVIKNGADFIAVPMRWVEMEPSEGRYDYTSTDRWIEWAVRTARLPVVAGPVVDFRPGATPEWLHIWENDYETLRELVYEHTKAVVTRYRRTVTRWTVASGLQTNTAFPLTWEQMMDLTRIAVFVVRKLHPNARVQVEVSQPWGEYYTANRTALPPMLYVDMLGQAGVQIDTIGLRVSMAGIGTGLSTRDLMSFSALLDQYAILDRPVALTAVNAPSAPTTTNHPSVAPGWWRTAWNPETQAGWMTAIAAIAASKPFVQSFCWARLADVPTDRSVEHAGLLDATSAPKPAAQKLAAVRRAFASASFADLPKLNGLLA